VARVRNRIAWLLVLVFAYAALFRRATRNRPFDYDDEATGGSFYGITARNYLRFSWASTHGMPAVTVGSRPDVPLVFYADHDETWQEQSVDESNLAVLRRDAGCD
jgi:hypothetical protein